MKSLLIIGSEKQHSFTKEEKESLKKNFEGYFSDEDLDARIPISFSIIKDSNGEYIPHIFFPSEQIGKVFFAIVKDARIYNAFTTMPFDDLVKFENQYFELPRSGHAITVSLEKNFDGLKSYSRRLFKFEKTELREVSKNMRTIVQLSYPDEAVLKYNPLYEVFLDPIKIDFDKKKLNVLFKIFFEDRKTLPIVLPATYEEGDENNYFGKANRLVREDIDSIIVKKYANTQIINSLAYKLWKGIDHEVLHDFFREGTFLELKSRKSHDDNYSLPSYSEEGMPVLNLIYPKKTTIDDFIISWRSSFFFDEKNNTDPIINSIRKAIIEDIQYAFKGIELHIQKDSIENVDVEYWNKVNPPPFTSNSMYYISLINDFCTNLDASNKKFINEFVIDIAGNGEGFDDNRALEIFCQRFWKYPFPRERESRSAWLTFLLQLINKEGKVDPLEFVSYTYNDALTKNEHNEFIYENNHRNEEILMMRLLLPVNAYLKPAFNNILDHSNAKLDNNLILD
ncbi:MAG: hypothetical protein QM737_01195 [Ferruginibacter sp.]